MSEKKEYTAEEVAKMIADHTAEVMKKNEISSEYMEDFMAKSKNSAHEIDPGQEPSSSNTEAQSMESSEDSEKEDQPLQGEPKKEEKKDSEESEDESEDEEPKKDDYEFKKNESGMHTVEYKRLVKDEGYSKKIKEGKNIEFSHSKEDGPSKEMSDAQQAMSGVKRRSNLGDQTKHKLEARDRKNKSREATASGKPDYIGMDDRRKKDKGIESREKPQSEQRVSERQRGDGHIKKSKDMDKCGDMKVAKSEKLSNFLKKNTSNKQ